MVAAGGVVGVVVVPVQQPDPPLLACPGVWSSVGVLKQCRVAGQDMAVGLVSGVGLGPVSEVDLVSVLV